jgi:hypothetical protein
VYITLTYATWVLLAVIASTLLFVLGVVVAQEALRIVPKKLSKDISLERAEDERGLGDFGARPTLRPGGSCAFAAKP